jgi:transposase-like protein
MSPSSARYPPDLQARAVQMVSEVRSRYSSEGEAIAAVARTFGIQSSDTLRGWVRKRCSDKRCPGSKEKRCRGCDCDGEFHGSTRKRIPLAGVSDDLAPW